MHPLSIHFQYWSDLDISDLCDCVRNLGETKWRERIATGNVMASWIEDPEMTPEIYNDFRVTEFGCVPCLRTIKRKWAEFRANPYKEVEADRATGAFVFGGDW